MQGKAYPSDPRIPAMLAADVLGADLQQSSDASVVKRDGVNDGCRCHQFPVVVYCHGLGGMRCDNSGICCDLASHGYVVAAVEHR